MVQYCLNSFCLAFDEQYNTVIIRTPT